MEQPLPRPQRRPLVRLKREDRRHHRSCAVCSSPCLSSGPIVLQWPGLPSCLLLPPPPRWAQPQRRPYCHPRRPEQECSLSPPPRARSVLPAAEVAASPIAAERLELICQQGLHTLALRVLASDPFLAFDFFCSLETGMVTGSRSRSGSRAVSSIGIGAATGAGSSTPGAGTISQSGRRRSGDTIGSAVEKTIYTALENIFH